MEITIRNHLFLVSMLHAKSCFGKFLCSKTLLLFLYSRCELCGSRVRLGRNILIGRSTWAVLSDTKHRDGEKYPRHIIKQKQCFIFWWHLHKKNKIGCPKKTTSHVGNSNFATFFWGFVVVAVSICVAGFIN